jgi:hypothetical protein
MALDFLTESSAKYLVTDAYTGYHKAIRLLEEKYNKIITEVFCNAHAYRYFKNASKTWKEDSAPPIELYKQIYKLEHQRVDQESNLSRDEQLKLRQEMLPMFENIKKFCEQEVDEAMKGSSLKKSLSYFLNHYEGLSLCTTDIEIPLDNNLSEREMRAPVIGRKTWFGNHSKRGAKTSAILFSIVHSCKMNNINPRNYFPWVVKQILAQKEALTPFEYYNLE